MSATARRNPDSTLILLGDRDLVFVKTPPAPPVRLAKTSPPPVKQGIRASRSAKESGVVRWSDAILASHERPANDPPSSAAEDSGPLDSAVLHGEPARGLASAQALNVALLVMAIAVLSAVASVVIHLSATA